MLRNNTFLASIFEGFGPRFGMVFGRFSGPKMHQKSDVTKSVREPFCIGKTNTKSMSELLQQSIFRAKIDEKSHVFWDLDFGRILGRFWEGFGRQKSSIFAFFSMIFRSIFRSAFWKAKNREKNRKKRVSGKFWGLRGGMCGPPGRDFWEGTRSAKLFESS